MNTITEKTVAACRSQSDSLLTKCHAFEPFPELKEETEQDFVNAMTANNLHTNLSMAVKHLETHLDSAKACAKTLGMPLNRLLPSFESTQKEVARLLGVCWTTTSLRILLSKPAKALSPHLKDSISKTLHFGEGLDVDKRVRQRLEELGKKIEKAANNNTRKRSRSR